MLTKEIGSNFKIPLSLLLKRKKYELPKGGIFLSTGRDCLEAIITHYKFSKNKIMLLPAYLCHEILVPLKKQGIKFRFYKINKNLEIDLTDFERNIAEGDVSAALFINYFGFMQPNREKIRDICKKNRVILIEDIVQSFLSEEPIIGDIAFNSYRKSTPLPDGAYLFGISNLKIRYSLTHFLFVYSRIIAGLLKNMRLCKPIYRFLFQLSEERFVNYSMPAKVSIFSKYLLERIDLEEVKQKRKKNYEYLVRKLKRNKKIKILREKIPARIYPFGLPILCENRDKIKEELIKNKIYPPIHWPLPEELDKSKFKDSCWILKRILMIPIDQRYDEKDMGRIAKVLNENV